MATASQSQSTRTRRSISQNDMSEAVSVTVATMLCLTPIEYRWMGVDRGQAVELECSGRCLLLARSCTRPDAVWCNTHVVLSLIGEVIFTDCRPPPPETSTTRTT